MIARTVNEIAEIVGGVLVSEGTTVVSSVSTDTRSIKGGELYVGLKGARFDGAEFAAVAAQAGAAALVLDRQPDDPVEIGVVVVEDTLEALQKLAAADRRRSDFRVVAITGSSGKTTVKDMVASVLRKRFRVTATRGNLNNHIGLPLSILAAGEEDEVGVFEMGMNHPGEIAPLAAIAAPEVGVVTNVGTAHIEHMGTRDAIAEEKAALLVALPADGVGVVPAEDDFVELLAERCAGHVVRAGETGELVAVEEIAETDSGVSFVLRIDGEVFPVSLPVPGHHMALNAALAAAVGRAFEISGAEIAVALTDVEIASGRLDSRWIDGVRFLDDTYNANPDSMAAALRTLGELKTVNGARRIAVLGRMAELGPHAEGEHRCLGERARAAGIDVLLTVGDEPALAWETAGELEGKGFDDCESSAHHLRGLVRDGDVVLVKGSRSAAMERVLQHFQKACSN